ncbi:hypothetical protein C5E45_10380 [Nocardia nova]|uniref:Acyl transferase n=1 Tax=Nocardia nova TaxID=37330 RepID=A0A2S6ASD7_9NOCA|nr:hypothetical protein [Nocardia nova]PPJ30251.1 hypothetical protein C5E41_10155 [Nocardia nova]PPJ38162.1 hypothetical protein C5E45_10380 [Nocardia nova]
MRSHTRLPRRPGHRQILATDIPRVIAVAIGLAVAASLVACSTDSPASEGPNTAEYRSTTQTTTVNTPGETDDGSGGVERPSSSRAEFPSAPTSELPIISSSVPNGGDHPPAGTAFPGEDISGDAAEQLQQSVDAGHQPWRLDEDAVARAFVSGRFGWSQPAITHGGPYLTVATGPNGQRVSLRLSQPARKNNGGVWVVESGIWL